LKNFIKLVLKNKTWQKAITLAVLGVAVYLILPQITDLENSWSVVQGMIWWAVALAVAAQVSSYIGGGFMLSAILDNEKQKLSTWSGVLITLASTSIGLVAGGWVGDAAATYGWVHRELHDKNAATLAGTLPPILNTAILAGVTIIGTIYLLLVHDLSQIQLIGFGIILLVLVLTILGIVAALYFSETTTALAVKLANRWAIMLHKPIEPEKTIASLTQFFVAWNFLKGGRWRGPVLGAVANISFDMLTLYFLFIAAGYNVSPAILFAGYGLPFILAKLAFLFPGGIGVIEGSMVALYDSLQVPNSISVVVVLVYRLLSFWLPTLLGFAAAAYLSRKSTTFEKEQA
jgi:uncharacterized protein (TIRG00374 family)